jgi:tetratricopeptide (TPR) repeat protein
MEYALDLSREALTMSEGASLRDLQGFLQEKIKWLVMEIKWTKEKKMLPSMPLNEILEAPLVTLLSIEPKPQAIENLYSKEFAFHKLGEHEKSIQYADKILDLEPNNCLMQRYKGQSLCKLRRWEESIEYYDKCLETNPGYTLLYHDRARALRYFLKNCIDAKIREIALEAIRKPKDQMHNEVILFKQLLESYSDYKADELESNRRKRLLFNLFDELLGTFMREATRDSPFEIPAKVFQFSQACCEELYGEEGRRQFTDIFNERILSRFSSITLGDRYKLGPIESERELALLLSEFERNFGELGARVPSIDEIKLRAARRMGQTTKMMSKKGQSEALAEMRKKWQKVKWITTIRDDLGK